MDLTGITSECLRWPRTRPIATGLPKHITEFCRQLASIGCVVIVPRTAVLENERHGYAVRFSFDSVECILAANDPAKAEVPDPVGCGCKGTALACDAVVLC